MSKMIRNPETALYPLPAVLVSMGKVSAEYNIITISWTGTINSNPPMCYISVRPERHSYDILKRNMEFVINLTSANLIKAADWCGVNSGKDFDKFKEMHLTAAKANIVDAPIIVEAPVNIECRVKEIFPLGSHHMFMANVVSVSISEEFIDKHTGVFMVEKARLVSYAFKHYFASGEDLGKYGQLALKKNS